MKVSTLTIDAFRVMAVLASIVMLIMGLIDWPIAVLLWLWSCSFEVKIKL